MIRLVRAAVLTAALAFGLAAGLVSAEAADKAFKRDDLADAAIKLEAQIKTEAGPVNKPVAALRNDADAALRRGDVRATLQILDQRVGIELCRRADVGVAEQLLHGLQVAGFAQRADDGGVTHVVNTGRDADFGPTGRECGRRPARAGCAALVECNSSTWRNLSGESGPQ